MRAWVWACALGAALGSAWGCFEGGPLGAAGDGGPDAVAVFDLPTVEGTVDVAVLDLPPDIAQPDPGPPPDAVACSGDAACQGLSTDACLGEMRCIGNLNHKIQHGLPVLPRADFSPADVRLAFGNGG